MDFIAEMRRITSETLEVRNEVLQMKETCKQQNEQIVRLLEQNELLTGLVVAKHSLAKNQMSNTREATMKNTESDESEAEPEPEGEGLEYYFPIKTQRALDHVEASVTEDNKEQLVRIMKAQLRPYGLIKNFTHIFGPELIMQYNLDGRHNKKRLLDYPKILHVLYKALRTKDYKQPMYWDEFRRALQLAKKRCIKRRSVLNKLKREMEDIDDDSDE